MTQKSLKQYSWGDIPKVKVTQANSKTEISEQTITLQHVDFDDIMYLYRAMTRNKSQTKMTQNTSRECEDDLFNIA